MNEILFRFPDIPQSVNKLYFSRGHRRVKSAVATKFVNTFVTRGGGVSPATLMQFRVVPEAAYELHLWFMLSPERLYNASYGTDRRYKSPFQDIDTSNMVKLAEDSIATLLGMKDRANWSVLAHKREAVHHEEMVAILRPLNLSEDPYPCPAHN